MTDRKAFYRRRDQRTGEYGLSLDVFDTPVGVVVGRDAASTPGGQFLVLALVNMLSRLHRHLVLDIPAEPLLVRMPLVSGVSLSDAATGLARAIDPFIKLESGMPSQGVKTLGVGGELLEGLSCYVSGSCWGGMLSRFPLPVIPQDGPTPGAAMAACLGAAALLRHLLGDVPADTHISLWNLAEGAEAREGPSDSFQVDVGNVLMVGAGGVGCSLAYWLGCFGVCGRWIVVDNDFVELSNTNRCLGFMPKDAGWPTGPQSSKALIAAALFGGEATESWYHDFAQDSFAPDLVLPLANEHGVRYAIGQRSEPILLHATTGQTWNSQLHRHIPEVDQCISCRFKELDEEVDFKCSHARVQTPSGTSTDAALPFLSASAALMLYAALQRLAHGEMSIGSHNKWNIDFKSCHRYLQESIARCGDDCVACPPRNMRAKLRLISRWSHIDQLAELERQR